MFDNNTKLIIYYQPIIDAKTNKITKTEALARIIDCNNQIINPDKFISKCEQNGKILCLGKTLLNLLCQDIQKHQELQNISFSINASPLEIQHPDFADCFLSILDKYNINHSNIVLEITESINYSYTGTFSQNLQKLIDSGIKLALDDLGQGTNGLSQLNTLPIKIMKIDKKYIDHLCTSNNNKLLVQSLIKFCKSKNLTCVAEGIENIEQYNWLKNKQCDCLQGYLFSKPVGVSQYLNLLNKYNQNLAKV